MPDTSLAISPVFQIRVAEPCHYVKRFPDPCRKVSTTPYFAGYSQVVEEADNGTPPDRHVTVDQVVAWNIAWYRRAAGLTQEQLGALLGGWSKVAVSAAERSVDESRDRRRFDAQTLSEFAIALGVPIIALFLPPVDDSHDAHYLFPGPGEDNCPEDLDMTDLMTLVMPDSGEDTPVMHLYRDRFRAAVGQYLDKFWATEVARWFEEAGGPELRADRAARIRMRRDTLLAIAAEYGELADIIEKAGGES